MATIDLPTPPGGHLFVSEAALPLGSRPDPSALTDSWTFRISAPGGVHDLTVGGYMAIRDGVFTPGSIAGPYGNLSVTDYDPGAGSVTAGFELTRSHQSHPGSQQRYGDFLQYDVILTDRAGGADRETLLVQLRDDETLTLSPDVATAVVGGASGAGNLLRDGTPDRFTADGFGRISALAVEQGVPVTNANADGSLTVQGNLGVLTVQQTGAYQFVANADAAHGATARFTYFAEDGDGDRAAGALTVTVQRADRGDGQILTSDGYGDVLAGGAGADTLIAGRGPDRLTGAGGGDAFVFRDLPWNAGHVTDFAIGADRIDLSALFQASGYSGTDPIAAGYVRLEADGSGGAKVLYDTDGRSTASTIEYLITTLDHIAPHGLTWAQLNPHGSSGGPGGRVIDSPGPGSRLEGGAGADTLNGSQGPDVLTGGGGADVFAWAREPWAPASVTDFAIGIDRIDLSTLFASAGYGGSDPVGDRYISFVPVQGGTGILYDRDGAGSSPQYANYIIRLDGIPWASVTWGQISSGQGQARFDLSPGVISRDEGNAASTTFSYNVVRSGPAGEPAVIQWSTTGNSARPATGDDFTGGVMPRGSVAFAAGETVKSIDISVVADRIDEFDEQFILSIVGVQGGTVGPNPNAVGLIVNDDAPGPGDGGVVINSPAPGAPMTGGAGNDTLNAGQGGNTLRGNGGADAFVYANLPWSAGRVVDFTVGTDRLDLSGLLRASGYAGADPIADGYVSLIAVGGASTRVLYDTDGPAPGNSIQFQITTLDNVSPDGLTWTKLVGGVQAPPPPPPTVAEGRMLTWRQHGDTLAGGSGPDTINGSQGQDRLTGGAGADQFTWADIPWNAGHITDFNRGEDRLDLRALFDDTAYAGSDPVADGWLRFEGGPEGTRVLLDIDGAGAANPYWFLITHLDGVRAQLSTADYLF